MQEGELDSPSALFDLVDDAVYGRIVQQRQQEAFVLDDGVCVCVWCVCLCVILLPFADGSYTDHGREVFEEEEMPTKKVARKVCRVLSHSVVKPVWGFDRCARGSHPPASRQC